MFTHKRIICKDTKEEFDNYLEYLSSEHWKKLKDKYWHSKLPKSCYVCHTTENLNLHHKTYKRIGREWLADLILLCKKHHQETHEHIKTTHAKYSSAHRRIRRKYNKSKH
jgi:hypothetical protein